MLVCPLEGPEGVRGKECFLWVTAGHLFEVELQAARTLERLELQSLEAAEIEAETQAQGELVPEVRFGLFSGANSDSTMLGARRRALCFPQSLAEPGTREGPWEAKGRALGGLGGRAEEQSFRAGAQGRQQKHFNGVQSYCVFPCLSLTLVPLTRSSVQGSDLRPGAPVLALRFSYICPDRQLRRYVVLEPDAQEAVQVTSLARDQVAGGRLKLEGWGPAYSCGRPALL